MRSDDELLQIFCSAFALSCEARIDDYGKQIIFKVLDGNSKLLREGVVRWRIFAPTWNSRHRSEMRRTTCQPRQVRR
jgi:hypothetical protein